MKYQPDGGISIPDGENELEVALESAIAGDERAFEMIYQSLNPRLVRYCASQCYGSSLDYEELLAESWISIARDISKFTGDFAGFRSWVYSIARNRIRDGVRRRTRQVKSGISLDELHDSEVTATAQRMESLIESDEAVTAIVAEIKKLPNAQSEVVLLRVVADLSIEECAKLLGKNENSIRVLSHRGLAALREALKGAGS